MAEQRHADEAIHGQGRSLRRRGLIAGAAALVAGIAAKRAADGTPVAASSGLGDEGFLALGSNPWYISGNPINTNNQAAISSAPTVLQASPNYGNYAGSNGGHRTVFEVDARPSAGDITGIVAFGAGHYPGVVGNGNAGGIGVQGFVPGSGTGLPSTGVYGETSQYGYGVHGKSTGDSASIGVYGETDIGRGVYGQTFNSGGTGVYGVNYGSGAGNGNGVFGFVGHVGTSQVTAGVFGDSDSSYGVIGRTSAANYSGCTGVADGAGRAAFAGAGTNGAYGAYFTGPTVVAGNFTVINGQKNAAVKHTDGSYRLMHCVEAPEAWFEDFGKAKLVNGAANVNLDADFAAVVDATDYHVFLTTYGASQGLDVVSQSATGFRVQERNKGTGSLMFGYRIVAKRKDINPGRMAKFDLPKIKLPKPEEMPPTPQAPKKP